MPHELLFLPLLFFIAFLYASVGHGGASGYLAVMALFSISPVFMKPSALILNILVSGVAFIQYYRKGFFRWKLFLPFAIASFPFAFLGATVPVSAELYKIILAVCLLIACGRMFFINQTKSLEIQPVNYFIAVLCGIIIGFVSGMIGIGGGILLSPLLVLTRWSDLKTASAVSALFIFVNSISGVVGVYQNEISFPSHFYSWILFAFAGGVLGSFLGAGKMNQTWLKYILLFVLVIAVVKLLVTIQWV
ncbi:MAG: hypothetical protein A3H98_05500 [Bacteroidetes bacterium RIFCSPLOWO2_02_FULL_36_8]|nr:MAG: hypothetical protein A3H98_05500 [Bacteroidetes bacterium RIFCSPLOWO2_02_FULL_36_8]OFY70280.1 MAG: hypothetical protein A3G23_09090 [Bacteroidetes bacterium RIFCSPLOWO2_12_FULL_37_12]